MSDKKPPIGKPFPRGTSGNPGGKPKGIGRLVRETVGDDMPKIIKAQIAIALGQKPEGYRGSPPKPSHITKAAEWVRDTGWHKPRQVIDHEGTVAVGTMDLTKLTRDELEDWLGAADRADEDDDGSADAAESPPPG